MNAAGIELFSRQQPCAGAPSRVFFEKQTGALLFSVVLHAVLLAVALFLSAANGGGMPGSGAGGGSGPGGAVLVTGLITLHGGHAEGEDAAIHDAPEALPVADAVSEAKGEEVPLQAKDGEPPQAETDAIPVQAPRQRDKDDARNNAQARRTGERARTSAQTDTREPARVRRVARASAAQASRAGHEAETGRTDEKGSGGGSPGSGSGPHSGMDGAAEGPGTQGTGFSGAVDRKPRVISRSKVTYPDSARKRELTGHVLLRFHLDADGSVSQLQVVKAEPSGVFEEAALAAVRQWRFAPAMKDGRPVPYWVELPMPFLLK